MTPEQDQDGVWFITLPDGERKEFKTNAEAWGWVDRQVGSRRQWRVPPTYALPAGSSKWEQGDAKMKTATEIVRLAPYGRMHIWCEKHQCRHPIDKPCDASIEAYRLEFEAEVREGQRQRKKKAREKSNEINDRVQDATVENIDESPDKVLGLNAIGKAYGASFDPNYRVKTSLTSIKRLYAPMKPAAPPSSPPWETLLEKAWLQATPKAKRQFLGKYWDEILREKSAADDERTTEDAPSLVAVEPVSAV